MTVAADQNIKNNENVPVSLSGTWQFTQKVKPENYAKIPAGCKKFEFDQTRGIDLDTVAGKKEKGNDECILYKEIELKEDAELGFGIGADWWVEVYLNGKKIFSTFPSGNESHRFSSDDHSFRGSGKKGRNLLAVRARRGSGSWIFCMAGKPAVFPVTITVDPQKKLGKIKPMNAVNNGPIESRGISNMEEWKAVKIPYVRNHDASFCASYGGEHTVDIHAVFPDFSKDPKDPASYDFAPTDRYLKSIMAGGSKVFYRLGSKIEHAPEKYGTRVPADFKKWAVVCEHIIRHYNEGWANGFKWDIVYWEIWNEPELPIGPNGTSPTWQGTPEQFYELYGTTASHLKKCFPNLKIGGPALAGMSSRTWLKNFMAFLTAGGKRIPLDFFSWHLYTRSMAALKKDMLAAREVLDKAGYTKTESILSEWNYVSGWSGEEFMKSINFIIGLKGAAFTASAMCVGQNNPVDMLMYYDARPCRFNGLFDFYSFKPLKTYYAFLAWAKLADLGRQIAVDTQNMNGLFAVGASDGKKTGVLLSRYLETENPADLTVTLSLKNGDLRDAKLYLIDETHDLAEIPYKMDQNGNLLFDMKANTIVYLEK